MKFKETFYKDNLIQIDIMETPSGFIQYRFTTNDKSIQLFDPTIGGLFLKFKQYSDYKLVKNEQTKINN